MSIDTRPVATTVERIINHIYMMYPTLSRQETIRIVKRAIISAESSFLNSFKESVCLCYYDDMMTLTDACLRIQRQFVLPRSLADIYLYGTLDRYPHFDSSPYRIDEKPLHRCRRYVPLSQKELLDDIEQYFGGDREKVPEVLSSLLHVRKNVVLQNPHFQIEFLVDDLSYPALCVTKLNYGHLAGGEPRKKYTHYDLRSVIDIMCYSRI